MGMAGRTPDNLPVKYQKAVKQELRKISATIARCRTEELKLTQRELAEQLGVSPVMINFIEQGRRYPSLPMLLYILKWMGIPCRLG